MIPYPEDLRDPRYAQAVLEDVAGGDGELTWTPVPAQLWTGSGPWPPRIVFRMNARPLRCRGVFVNVSATLQQHIADMLGALLPTPKMMDLAWLARPVTIPPVVMPIAATLTAMQTASARLDHVLAGAGDPPGVMVCQKTWAIGQSLLDHAGRAMNYGDFVVPDQGTKWQGIRTEACVSIRSDPKLGRVIQGQGWAHDPSHLDYSQVCWLVQDACTVDGAPARLREVLVDKLLAPAVSHEGALTLPGLRQPGVPVIPTA